MIRRPPRSTLFPSRRSSDLVTPPAARQRQHERPEECGGETEDRKSTRLNSSHSQISYAVFCLKKKKKHQKLQLSCMLIRLNHNLTSIQLNRRRQVHMSYVDL